MIVTAIQLVASVIQAAKAGVFLISVVWDAKRRARLSEQGRREAIIKALHYEWNNIALPGPPKNTSGNWGDFQPAADWFFQYSA